MQPNEIILGVDVANDATIVNRTFTRFDTFSSRSIFHSELHVIDARDVLNFYRAEQKQNGNFKGVAKTAIKLTKDIVVLGVDGLAQLTSPIIAEVSFSLPVGVTTEQVVEIRQRLIALLDQDTMMNALNMSLAI